MKSDNFTTVNNFYKIYNMRNLLRLAFVALFCLVSVAMNAQADRVIKILTIGNSFSEDAVEQHLHDLAKAEDIKVIIGNMYIGGCSLERHLNNARDNKAVYKYRKIGLDGKKVETKPFALETALADEQWDYVSFQQNSGRSGQYDTWIASLGICKGKSAEEDKDGNSSDLGLRQDFKAQGFQELQSRPGPYVQFHSECSPQGCKGVRSKDNSP